LGLEVEEDLAGGFAADPVVVFEDGLAGAFDAPAPVEGTGCSENFSFS
jgi:hypothetical protein